IGYKPEEYKLGRTKIFIRFPRTLFATEDAFEYRKHLFALHSQNKPCVWCAMSLHVSSPRYIIGFINRKNPPGPENGEYLQLVQYTYLMKLRDHVPKNVLDKNWLQPPFVLEENLIRFISKQMQQKVVASAIFQGKKDGYLQSLNEPFVETRLKENDLNPKVLQLIRGEKIKYVTPVTKYDRNGFKPRGRQLVLTQTAAYVVELAKIKQKIEYATLKGISTSSLSDGILVIHVPQDKKQKGDVILQCENIFETVTKLCMLANKQEAVKVVQESLRVRIGPGKESTMVFTAGQELQIYKAKNGQLTVVHVRRVSLLPTRMGVGRRVQGVAGVPFGN
uniref:MYO1H protein n=1 Tax=Sphenodon punctatus TaxID=8508 RepID=A0A8D0GTP6_SPHPU